MIPLKDENPSRSFPIVTILLILVNTAAFLYQAYWRDAGPEGLLLRLGCIPYELSHLVDLEPKAPVPVLLTPVTAMFLHAGWLHLLSNMLFLWIFGDNVEDILGHFRYLLFYVISGLAASILHISMNADSRIPMVGASGAIAGVMGAYMFLFPMVRVKTLVVLVIFVQVIRIPAIVFLGYWILIQISRGLLDPGAATGGGVAWFAHLGGFVGGSILLLLFNKRRRARWP